MVEITAITEELKINELLIDTENSGRFKGNEVQKI
jgi:hypothetical protein